MYTAYDKASKEAKRDRAMYKMYYDKKIRYAVLKPEDCVLIQNVCLTGRQNLADKWQKQPNTVTSQPIPAIPIYEVQRENGYSKPYFCTETCFCNLLAYHRKQTKKNQKNLKEIEGKLRKS